MATIRAALVQTTWTGDKESMIKAHEEYARQAAAEGAQVTACRRSSTGRTSARSRTPKWYDTAEPDRARHGAHAGAREAARAWCWSCRCTSRADVGVLLQHRGVIEKDGTLVGKYRKTHIPQVGPCFWEKFYFKPGNLGYPGVRHLGRSVGLNICYDRHFPEGWRALGLKGAQIVFNPSATVEWLSEVPVGARAAGPRRRERVLDRRHQPRRRGGAARDGEVLRLVLLLRPARQDPGRRRARRGRADRPRRRLGLNEKVRNTWQFLRDRRPGAYERLCGGETK